MVFDKSYIYVLFFFLSAAAFFLIVPNKQYKKMLIYGIIFGGIGDALFAVTLTMLGFIKYKNMGAFGLFGVFSSWTPVTWTLIFGLFFYLLPIRKAFLIPYILAFAALTYGTALVFEQFGIFEYSESYRYIAPFGFLVWYLVSAWVYLRNSKLSLK